MNAFQIACKNGQLEEAKRIIGESKQTIDIHANNEFAFRWACSNGHLKVAQLLLSLKKEYGKIDIHANDELAFRWACEYGHLKVAQWLLSLKNECGKINIHADNEYAFSWACFNGHLKVTKWLWNTFKYSYISLSKDHKESKKVVTKMISYEKEQQQKLIKILFNNHPFEGSIVCYRFVESFCGSISRFLHYEL